MEEKIMYKFNIAGRNEIYRCSSHVDKLVESLLRQKAIFTVYPISLITDQECPICEAEKNQKTEVIDEIIVIKKDGNVQVFNFG
jgi:hypothetical protein